MDAILIFEMLAALTTFAGVGFLAYRRYKTAPEPVPEINPLSLEPVVEVIQPEYTDEYLYLKDFIWARYDPPKYVEPGRQPTEAARDMTRKTGIRHHTRRVE